MVIDKTDLKPEIYPYSPVLEKEHQAMPRCRLFFLLIFFLLMKSSPENSTFVAESMRNLRVENRMGHWGIPKWITSQESQTAWAIHLLREAVQEDKNDD